MATTIVAPEPQCQHLSRTDAGKPDSGRQVCDDCKQIFQGGVPAPKIGQQLSDLTPEAEVPTATKAAASRAKKARKPKVGKAEGAKTINLNSDELARGKKADEEKARQEYIDELNADVVFVYNVVSSFANLSEIADDAIAARDEYFATEMKNPEFAKRVQNLRDFGSTKKNNEVLTVNGKTYKSIKVLFKDVFGVTYEYVRQLGLKNKLGRFGFLLEEGKPNQSQNTTTGNPTGTQTPITVPPAEETPNTETPAKTFTHQPEVKAQAPVPPEKNLHSVPEMVQTTFGYVISHYKFLSLDERETFLISLIARLEDELGLENEFVTQAQAAEAATA